MVGLWPDKGREQFTRLFIIILFHYYSKSNRIIVMRRVNEMFIRDYARYTRAYSEDELDIIFGDTRKTPKKAVVENSSIVD